ncbi:DUF6225 family protein [Asanoa sp. NPDC049518]|uniref:DUF6225 family protein n=1 Tax=unclassified Asanoa TaxID=2685164 RepID=UPI00341D4686
MYRRLVSGSDSGGRYRHDVQRWTVGQLREALQGLPAELTLRVEVSDGPSTLNLDPWGNDQFVVTGADVDDEDDFSTGDLVIRVDYSSDWYMGTGFGPTGEARAPARPLGDAE